ncbi:hypothetical protein D3C75_389630 [compost metagenome]
MLAGILLAGLRPYLQRIDIEIMLPVIRHAGSHRVVQRALHDIPILALRFRLKHTAREEDQADGSTGLGVVGVVRQVVVKGEGFPVVSGADASVDIHLLLDDIAPQALAGRKQTVISAAQSQVRHRGVHIYRTDGMAGRNLLLTDGLMSLKIIEGLRRLLNDAGRPV